MLDVLLSFPSQTAAAQLGMAFGYTTQDEETKEFRTTQATLDMAVCVIGEHFIPQPNDVNGDPAPPIGDGKWWVMIRSMKDVESLPPGAWDAIQPYLVIPNDEDPSIPKQRWA